MIGLHDGGVSLREISRRTGRSRTAARSAIKAERGPQSGDSREKPRAGRQPALTDREVRQIVRAASTGKFFAAELKTQFGVKTSWAEKHILNPGTWEYTIFSDEKKFNLDGPDGYKYYWRDLRQPAQSYVRCQNGGGSVMVWGAFGAKGKSQMAILRGRQNSGDYIYTVSEYLLPFAHASYGVDFVFQQDNASIHTSRETTHFLQETQVDTMVWLARSPDCNPIENVWSAMATRVYAHGRQYRMVEQLEDAIVYTWGTIEQAYLDKLVESMPSRCLAVIKGKGAFTKY
ncbi:hypothetical protein AM588_10001449 [Phytophthora nicotianae]|uniref:Tc1-like transposase DDE domain-containing protein n=1 Tax=Phytophthora nicotianae TaxID=4792 RepID=A0A0W8CT09_PHYNI|nr:hypothetical protein AM588_10001449 [Phytophthora nicotianae]